MLKKIVLFKLFIVLSFFTLYAEQIPEIHLKPGLNEISIKVDNKSDLDLQSVRLVVKNADLPAGVTLEKKSQDLDISAGSKSDAGLILAVNVGKSAESGIHTIPFLLKDRDNHRWSFKLTAAIEADKPKTCDLFVNFPNPFNPSTKIRYRLANGKEQATQLIIYDVLGKPVKTLVSEKQAAGEYTVIWDGMDDFGQYVSSGLYFYKLTSGSFTKIKKMTLLK